MPRPEKTCPTETLYQPGGDGLADRRSPDCEPIRCPRDEVDRHAGLMTRKLSAGLLLYRRRNQDGAIVLEVLLAHMGGPFWARKDDGAWSIPKGEYVLGEDPFRAAKREFEEELGSAPPLAVYRDLGSISQPGGKLVTAWAAEADLDTAGVLSNTFELEWPPGSGQIRSFPEIDKASWFTMDVARQKLVKGQRPLIDRFAQMFNKLA
jgi:predicted NUDIX family NTP pyrophosphohydrolase